MTPAIWGADEVARQHRYGEGARKVSADDEPFVVGDLVYDDGRGCLARVVDMTVIVRLRPADGGEEWDAPRHRVRRPTATEELSPRVAEINRLRRLWREHGV
jgi:hypothetical protein